MCIAVIARHKIVTVKTRVLSGLLFTLKFRQACEQVFRLGMGRKKGLEQSESKQRV